MGELDRVDNRGWIWIIIIVLLFSGGFDGFGSGGGLFTDLKCGNNSWIWILLLIFLFSDGFK